ncbi:MAG TPA: hypothetical protein PLG10_01710 [Candidatus Dojkabacteria bacterium]|jgi:hypothetical protein|nr:hypothetical protein [Candidatus Dojkabacteria bacterium]
MFSFFQKKKVKEDPEPIHEENYLVTQAVDTQSLSDDLKNADLNQLLKAEEKSNYRSNIAKSIKNPQISRAVSALQLKNPFKGV